MTCINSLPVETLIKIQQYLDIIDIVNFSGTDKFANTLFKKHKNCFYKMILRARGFKKFDLIANTKLELIFKQMHSLYIMSNSATYFNISSILICNKNYRMIIDFFIQNGTDINMNTLNDLAFADRKNILNIACMTGHLHIVEWILKDDKNIATFVTLHYAVENNHLVVVKSLFKFSTIKDNMYAKVNALKLSLEKNNYEIMEYILEQDIDRIHKFTTLAIAKSIKNKKAAELITSYI